MLGKPGVLSGFRSDGVGMSGANISPLKSGQLLYPAWVPGYAKTTRPEDVRRPDSQGLHM